MKAIKSLMIIGIVTLFSCQSLSAQPAPAITKKYTNEEIQKLISDSKVARSADIMPTEVLMQKFSTDFPNSHDIDWEVASGVYEVEFDIRLKDYKAYYDEQGNLLMYKHDIRTSRLPQVVKDAAKAKYPGYRFEDAEEIRQGTEVLYKVEMERRDTDITLLIKNDGTIINQYM